MADLARPAAATWGNIWGMEIQPLGVYEFVAVQDGAIHIPTVSGAGGPAPTFFPSTPSLAPHRRLPMHSANTDAASQGTTANCGYRSNKRLSPEERPLLV